jgi:bacteriocin biosynthesis cyclodehydratase domain-containing protein
MHGINAKEVISVMAATELEPERERIDPSGGGDFAVRPRLSHDVLFYDIGHGVVVRNTDEVYVVKGQFAYRFMCSLAPYLTGEHSVRDLCANLSPERQAMAVSLVRSLIERGFARNARLSENADIDPAVARLFSSQLNYVEHFVDDATARFKRFRNAKVLMLGTGRVNRAAAESLLRNGLGCLSLVASSSDSPAEDAAAARAGLAGCMAELTEAGASPTVLPLDLTVGDVLASHPLNAYDFVIASSDDIGMAALRRLVHAGVTGGPVVLPATSIGSKVIIGPITRPASAGCWHCSMLRYGANADPYDAVALWLGVANGDPASAAPAAPRLNPQLAAMVGNTLAFDLFRLVTGSFDAETDHGVLIQDILTLESKREQLWPHPLCPSCGDHQDFDAVATVTPEIVHEKPPRPFSADRDDRERLGTVLAEAAKLVGLHTGVLSSFDDATVDQSPLKVSRVRLGAQAGPGLRPRLITAFDLHYLPVARRSALRAALLVYVGQVASVRRAVTGSAAMPNTLYPTDLSGSTGLPIDDHEPLSWLAATSLVTGAQRLVPAAAVHPWSTLNSDSLFERSGAGGGAGATIGEAVRAGLLSTLAFEALRDAVSGRIAARRIHRGAPPAGSELEFLLRTFDNLDTPPEVLELSRWHNASVVLARTPDQARRPLWTVQAALSREAAVIAALRDLAGLVQMHYLAEAEEVDLGEPLLPGFDARVVDASDDPLPYTPENPTGNAAELVDELTGDRRDVLVVDTTTPELRSGAAVATVRVLLTRCTT